MQVVASTEGAVGSQNVFVAMYSVSSCIARGLVGQVSQQLLVCRGIPRPVFLALGSATMAASCFCSSAGSVRLLYVGTVLGGFAFGSFTTLMSVLTSEFFGSRSFATIYSTMIAAVAAGSVILSAGLVSYLYDAASRRHKDPGNTCRGPDCFRDSLLVMGVLSLVATLFSLALASKTRRQYLFVQAWIRETSTMGTLTVDGTE